jgi:hypothetical protein
LITDLEILKFADDIYYGQTKTQWDTYDTGTDVYDPDTGLFKKDTDGICWGLKTVSGFDVVAFRGSANILDWIRNAQGWTNPYVHKGLGPVHPGFMSGMEETWAEIKPLLKNPLILTGHSLGAARADILSGLAILDGVKPARVVLMGEPRPGFTQLRDLIWHVPRASYRNVDKLGKIDLVTTVPIAFPPEEYVHPTPMIDLLVAPDYIDHWGAFRLHHSELYLAGLATGPQVSPNVTWKEIFRLIAEKVVGVL